MKKPTRDYMSKAEAASRLPASNVVRRSPATQVRQLACVWESGPGKFPSYNHSASLDVAKDKRPNRINANSLDVQEATERRLGIYNRGKNCGGKIRVAAGAKCILSHTIKYDFWTNIFQVNEASAEQ